MRKALAFVRRDFLVEASYRASFAVELASIVLKVASYYFLARFLAGGRLPGLEAYGGDYFAFVLVGMALHDYLAMALDAFARSVREAQVTGTLEAVLTTRASLPAVVLGSALYPFAWTSFGVLVYVVTGAGLFGLRLGSANLGGALAVLVLAVAVFSGLGILAASFIMVFKRGSPVTWLFGSVSWLLGGVLYPVSVLPDWLARLAALLPITHAIEGMRAALLQAAPWSELAGSLAVLLLFATAVLPLAVWSFAWATRRARIDGTLAHA